MYCIAEFTRNIYKLTQKHFFNHIGELIKSLVEFTKCNFSNWIHGSVEFSSQFASLLQPHKSLGKHIQLPK